MIGISIKALNVQCLASCGPTSHPFSRARNDVHVKPNASCPLTSIFSAYFLASHLSEPTVMTYDSESDLTDLSDNDFSDVEPEPEPEPAPKPAPKPVPPPPLPATRQKRKSKKPMVYTTPPDIPRPNTQAYNTRTLYST